MGLIDADLVRESAPVVVDGEQTDTTDRDT